VWTRLPLHFYRGYQNSVFEKELLESSRSEVLFLLFFYQGILFWLDRFALVARRDRFLPDYKAGLSVPEAVSLHPTKQYCYVVPLNHTRSF